MGRAGIQAVPTTNRHGHMVQAVELWPLLNLHSFNRRLVTRALQKDPVVQ